jgi:mannose-6-phosphate isomerase-like protein (cupin superfamily)
MTVRRVSTGHDVTGKAIFTVDDQVAATTLMLAPAVSYHELWRADSTPTLPNDGLPTTGPDFFPPVGGYRFFILTLQPEGSTRMADDIDIAAGLREMEDKTPGMLAHSEAENPGMHRTDSVDFEIVLTGELVLELDDGAETVLRAGDVNIQNGTRHRWHNRGEQPATMACFLLGATRVGSAETTR